MRLKKSNVYDYVRGGSMIEHVSIAALAPVCGCAAKWRVGLVIISILNVCFQ